jgi:DNA-nicking Smr family endonuclease
MRAASLFCCPPERTGPVNENVPSSKKPRIRRLSTEEIELWLNVTRGVARRTGSRLPEPPEAQPEAEVQPQVKETRGEAHTYRPPAPAEPKTPPPLAPLERRLRQKLARGRAAPEAVIDLHGMRQQEAFIALRRFLTQVQGEGARLVLVVTGKGRSGGLGEGAPGILRQSVPHWLREPFYHGIIVGFEEAARPHGGTGAFYVRLRRRNRIAHEKGAP